MEAKCVEQYLCLVLAGKCWRPIKLSGDSKAIQLPVTNYYFLTHTLCFMLSINHEIIIYVSWIYNIFLVYDIVLLLQSCLKIFVFSPWMFLSCFMKTTHFSNWGYLCWLSLLLFPQICRSKLMVVSVRTRVQRLCHLPIWVQWTFQHLLQQMAILQIMFNKVAILTYRPTKKCSCSNLALQFQLEVLLTLLQLSGN